VQVTGLLTLLVVPAWLSHEYGLAVLQGLGRFRALNALRFGPQAVYALGVLALFSASSDSLPLVALAFIVPSLAFGAVTLVVALRRLPAGAHAAPPRSRMVRFGLRGLAGSASPVESLRLDQAVVGLFLSPVALGLYVVGLAFTNLPRFIAQSVGMVAAAEVAGHAAPAAARAALWRRFWLTVGLCTVVVAVLEAAAGVLVPLFFGDEFSGAVPVTRILLLAALFLSARRVLTDGARGAGLPGAGTVAEAVSWLVLVPALAVPAAAEDVEGVAWALVLASGVSLVVLILAVWRRAGRPPVRRADGDLAEPIDASVPLAPRP